MVAFLGLLIFITTLAFEYGRAAYWGFPAEFVQFTPENALATFVRLAVFSLLAGWVIEISRRARVMILVNIFCAAAAIFGAWRIAHLWGSSGLVLAVVGIMYSGWAWAILKKPDDTSGATWLIGILGKGGIALSVVMILVPYAALALGYISTSYQRDFVVATTEPRRIVLATYGSQAVCATLNADQRGQWISKSFFVVDLSSENVGNVTPSTLER